MELSVNEAMQTEFLYIYRVQEIRKKNEIMEQLIETNSEWNSKWIYFVGSISYHSHMECRWFFSACLLWFPFAMKNNMESMPWTQNSFQLLAIRFSDLIENFILLVYIETEIACGEWNLFNFYGPMILRQKVYNIHIANAWVYFRRRESNEIGFRTFNEKRYHSKIIVCSEFIWLPIFLSTENWIKRISLKCQQIIQSILYLISTFNWQNWFTTKLNTLHSIKYKWKECA